MRKLVLALLMLVFPAICSATSVQMLTGEQCASVYGGSGTCSDRARAFYEALGYSGTMHDMEYAYLGDLGYTGSWGDRWRQYLSGHGGGLQQKFREYGKAARGLTLYAPLHNPSNPIYLATGAAALSFTRATTATYVHPTTGLITSAASGQLRIESNGAAMEGERTNLAYPSVSGHDASWGNYSAVPGNDNSSSFDGSATMTRIVPSDDSNYHGCYTPTGASVSADTVYTTSVFVKAGTYTKVGIMWVIGGVASGIYQRFDLSGASKIGEIEILGTGSGTGSGIETVGGGIYRVWVSGKLDASSTTGYPIVIAVADDDSAIHAASGTDYFFAAGMQVEAGSFPSYHIPTTTAAVTRNADVLTVASPVDNSASTVALEWSPIFASTMTAGASYYLFDSGGAEAYYNATDQKIYLTDGTNTVSTAALTFSANVAQKLAFRWGPSGLAIYRNGASAASGATYTAGATNEYLFIGTDTSSANAAYSNIKTLKAWNRELSASEMGAITK